MTSVKEFRVSVEPTPTDLGRGAFIFTDAYSVFDWGQMPDDIPNKGAALCLMGGANFEALENAGIPTHYLGVGSSATRTTDIDEPVTEMMIELTQTPQLPYADGEYDYEAFHEVAGGNYLIPLEIVFRNEVPVGSSLRRRTAPEDHDLEFSAWPDVAVTLAEPIVEFSTKFEETDRYLSTEEADELAGAADLTELTALAKAVNQVITERAAAVGLDHLDGKIECLYHDGEIKVADVVGTFDENRFAYDGQQLSKEIVRQYYKAADPAWVNAVAAAKTEAADRGVAEWRSLCETTPQPLPSAVRDTIGDMYAAGANAFLERQVFVAPPLHAVAAEVSALDAGGE